MTTRWNPFVKQLVIVGGLIILAWLLNREQALLPPLVLTCLLAYLLSFPVNALVRHTGWPRTLVVVMVFVLVLLVIITAPVLVVPRLMNLISALGNTLGYLIAELAEATPKPIVISPTMVIDLGPFYAPINRWLTNILQPDLGLVQNLQDLLFPFATGAATVVREAVLSVITLGFMLFLTFYLLKDWPVISRWVVTRLPEPLLPEFRRLWAELAAVWDAFVRGQLTVALIMGLLIWIGMTILGIRNAPALGLLSGLAEFVPGVGPTIAAVIGIVIALLSGSTWIDLPPLGFAALTAGTYVLLSQFDNWYLIPRIVGRRVALHPIVVIVGAFAGAQLAGVLGLLLAAPTIASARVLFGYAFHKLLDEEPFPAPEAPRDQRLLWAELVRDRSPRAVFFDLDGTLVETDDVVVQSLARRLGMLQRIMPAQERMRVARSLLMASEVWINGLVLLLDRLHLDGVLFRFNDVLHRWRGIRKPQDFVPVSGTPEMMCRLADRYRLAIVTSRSRREAEAYLDQFGLTNHIYAVIGRDDVARLKPHPMPVQKAAQKVGVPVSQCVMVGDTGLDVDSAKAAGALAVGVLCGFGERVDLQNADLVLDSTAELEQWL